MCVEKFQLPKTITWIDTMNIFARMEKMRRLHTMAVAKRCEFIKKALNPQNRRYLQLDFFGEGRFVASYIEMEQKKFISEIFEGFTREERVMFGRMLWKINFNIQRRIQKSLATKNK